MQSLFIIIIVIAYTWIGKVLELFTQGGKTLEFRKAWKRHCNQKFSISAIEKLLAIEKLFQTKSLRQKMEAARIAVAFKMSLLQVLNIGGKNQNQHTMKGSKYIYFLNTLTT